MNGKSKCKILKEIRSQIAQNNDIEYVTSECKFQGECSGTCPKCEAEVRYLEKELEKRRKAGKAVAVAGIAAALVVGSTGCGPDDILDPPLAGDVPYVETDPEATGTVGKVPYDPTDYEVELDGDVVYDPTEDMLMGVIPYQSEP